MAIGPLSGPIGMPNGIQPAELPVRPEVVGKARAADPAVIKAAAGPSPPDPTDRTDPTELDELKELARHEQLELRMHANPDAGVVQIRIVEPTSGEVVREFPPSGLTEALAEMRARAASHIDARR